MSCSKLSPFCIWFTGLSASGKTTIANALKQRLDSFGLHTHVLDGDVVRQGLCKDLGFSIADRIENLRRVSEVARIMVNAGIIVLVSFISPFKIQRLAARNLFERGQFIEVFVDASLESCEHRDPKGLYAKARQGEIPDFTGIDSPYEAPVTPELHLQTDQGMSAEECVEQIIHYLQSLSPQPGVPKISKGLPEGRMG